MDAVDALDALDALEQRFVAMNKQHQEHRKAAQAFVKSLSPRDKSTLRYYQNIGYGVLNQVLYDKWALKTVRLHQAVDAVKGEEGEQGSMSEDDARYTAFDEFVRRVACRLPSQLLSRIRDLDDMFAKAPRTTKPMTVYRGVAGAYASSLSKVRVGRTIDMDTYLSTSFNPTVSYEFTGIKHALLMVVEVPKGTPYVYMDAAMGRVWESELLLPRGCRLQVTARHASRVDPTQRWGEKRVRTVPVMSVSLTWAPTPAPAALDTSQLLLTLNAPSCGSGSGSTKSKPHASE
jgi:hypothetical protein